MNRANERGEMDAKTIAGQLARTMFHFRRYLIVSNVSWGMLPWEADLLAMSSNGYLTEVEIKISVADLKRDATKKKWGRWDGYHDMIKARWFAMPEAVWTHPAAPDAVPPHAGVITLREPRNVWDDGVTVVRQAEQNKAARPLTETERYQLARLGAMRHWAKLTRDSRKRIAA